MTNINRAMPALLVLLAAFGCGDPQPAAPAAEFAETIYTNARVYTVDADNSRQQAFALRDGRYIAVGGNEAVLALQGPATTVVDLNDRFVMPGIQDTHLHPLDGGIKNKFECSFDTALSTTEIVAKVAECVDAADDSQLWIRGGQWSTDLLEQSPPPHRALLDAVGGDHAIFLMDWSVHNAWANTKALAIFGIDDATPDPVGGEILRDADGSATGILVDNSAYSARSQIPPYSEDQLDEALAFTVNALRANGVTAFRDAITTKANAQTYARLDTRGALPLRAQLSNPWKSAWSQSHAEELTQIEQSAARATDRIDARFAKIMLDGVPLTYTSAVLEPYEDSPQYGPDHLGELMIEAGQLAEDVAWLDAQQVTIKIHATGDRAVRVALDAIAHARDVNGDNGIQHEISHAEMIHADDLPRFRQLNVAAEMSPILWFPGPAADAIRATLGERADSFWPVKSLLDAGAQVIYGSDWPAVTPNTNPWPGIEAMVTRANPYQDGDAKLAPHEAVDLATALRIFTINGARAGKRDHDTGTIETGKYADFIVLDRDPFEIPVQEISDTRILHTYVAGEEVYRATTEN